MDHIKDITLTKNSGNRKLPNIPPFIQKHQISILLLAISLITFLAYLPSLSNGFMHTWDDQLYVTENPLVSELTTKNVKKIFSTNVAGNYHPLTVLSLAVNYQLSGQTPFPYHLTNLLIHILNTLLVFWLIQLLTGRKIIVSAFTALLFGIHPMHVESVAWIAERKDVLHTFFYLLAAITYVYYSQKEKWIWYPVALLFFVLAVLSKGTAVTLVGVLVLIDFLLQRKWNWKLIVDKLPFIAIAIYFGLMAVDAQAEHEIVSGLGKVYSFKRLTFAGYGFVMYIAKLLVPINLSALYPYPDLKNGIPLMLKISPFISLIILSIAAYSIKFTRVIVFGIGFYLVTVVLVLQYIQVGAAIMAERYTYIPYIGLLLILGYGMHYIFSQKSSNWKIPKMATGVLASVFTLFCTIATFNQCKIWKNGSTLWSNVISNYPESALAYNNRGNYYLNVAKEHEKAKEDYSKAISLKPNYVDAYTNRGNYFYKKKDFKRALADYESVIAHKPKEYSAYNNRGGVHFALGDYPKAIKDYEKVVQMNPQHFRAYSNMGACYSQLGEDQKAIEFFNKALQVNPKMGVAYLYRSYSWNSIGQYAKALQDARQARKLGVKVKQDYINGLK